MPDPVGLIPDSAVATPDPAVTTLDSAVSTPAPVVATLDSAVATPAPKVSISSVVTTHLTTFNNNTNHSLTTISTSFKRKLFILLSWIGTALVVIAVLSRVNVISKNLIALSTSEFFVLSITGSTILLVNVLINLYQVKVLIVPVIKEQKKFEAEIIKHLIETGTFILKNKPGGDITL